MVHRADEEIYSGVLGKTPDERSVRWANPLSLKADEDLDLICILGTQTNALGEVALVPWKQQCCGVPSFNLLMASVYDHANITCRNTKC